METYLAPLCTVTSTQLVPGVLGVNWLSVIAVVLVTAGQVLAARNA
jgi:hypothetical protein